MVYIFDNERNISMYNMTPFKKNKSLDLYHPGYHDNPCLSRQVSS